ncbi:TRAPP II complex [Parasitella parasitica]|nr:TRAPP II complex [Parasitella parasitica]
MDLAIDVTSSCRVRVLLVPVSPIKKSTFYKYVELVKTFNLVRLGDVTPDLKKGANAMFSSQVFQEGQMHFQFITHWTREHAELEDFQPHRRIFGVIGIMDCQEWKNKNLSEGFKQFSQGLDQYPTAVATRCFAFDPSESQEDDTKGLIMIPNVGNMSFYMSTMICDFASEILEQFAILATRIQKLDTLESPGPTNIHVPLRRDQQRFSQPPLATSPSSSSNVANKRSSLQPHHQLQPQSVSTKHHRYSTSTLNSTGSTGESARTRKRTPGRIRKLLGDFYLLAGRLPDAVSHYDQAIEMAKITSDFLWLASAMEGLVCATILLEYLQADIGHIIARNPVSPDPTTPGATSQSNSESSSPSSHPDIRGSQSTIAAIIDQYTAIIKHYQHTSLAANFSVPDLVYAEACLKIARLLSTAFLNQGWNDQTMALLVQGKLGENDDDELRKKKGENFCFLSTSNMVRYKGSGISRHRIAEWVTKIRRIHISELGLLDQIYVTTAMSSIYTFIGYHRKAAWLMHEGVDKMLPLLLQHRRSGLPKDMGKLSTVHDNGVLEILKRICEIYGIGERNVHDGGALEAMRQEDQELFSNQTPSRSKGNIRPKENRFGWPELQIVILEQCISVSDALVDNASRLYYTTVLLKNLYQYIPKAEQIKLATTIQGMVANTNRDKKQSSLVCGSESINYWGVNIVSRIEAKKPISRKAVYAHPIKNEAVVNAPEILSADPSDPFIYNPFAKKTDTAYKVVLVKDEISEFMVTLVNPFGFDLELQSIALSTSGIAFNAVSTAVSIPANATIHIHLTGTPEKTGTLVIKGCLIQIIGFAEQEFLVDDEVKESQDSSNDNFVKIKHSGLGAIETNRRETSGDTSPIKFQRLDVIDDQPLLKIKSTSLLHGAVMLYEGEVTQIIIELENIGNIAVDFITLSFTDSTTTNMLVNPELTPEDQYDIELYTKGTRVFSWEGTSEKRSNDFIGKKIWLPRGASTTVTVSVYGKRECHGGTIQVDYGYLDRTVEEIQSLQSAQGNILAPATFYTRQLYLNVLITVYQNVEPFNWDILYLRHSTPASKEALNTALNNLYKHKVSMKAAEASTCSSLAMSQQPIEDLLLVTRNVELENQQSNEYCLITLDVRNRWTTPFDVDFVISNKMDQKKTGDMDELVSHITVQPGSTSRIILPLKRLFLPPDVCRQEIPSFDPNKQFVVSQGPKISKEQQKARLQMFWYREELLNRIKGAWRCGSTGRKGELNLRSSLKLTFMQLGILKKENVEFVVELKGDSVRKLSHRKFTCVCNDYVTMTVSIRNRFTHPIKLILRIQPVQSYNDGVKEYDLSNKLLLEGIKQVVLPETPATDGITSHSFPMYFLSRGQFELLYHAEDVHSRNIYYDHEWATIDVTEK